MLIILLMFAPLRGVVAVPCDFTIMGDAAEHHSMMPAHDMSAMPPADMNEHNCCEDVSLNCPGVCDLGLSFSLPTGAASYSPVYKFSFKPAAFSSEILFRELTPPSRPPAKLHS